MRIRTRLVSVLAMILAGVPAYAQVYKWVDANGVTNYSGKRPDDVRTAKETAVVTQRITVYTPDEALMRAVAAAQRGGDKVLSDRIDALERRLQAERQARQYAAAAQAGAWQSAYDQCVAERRVDCNGYSGYVPYAPMVVVPFRVRQAPFVPVVALNGVTAGNVTSAIQTAGGTINATPGVSNSHFGAFRSPGAARWSRGYSLR